LTTYLKKNGRISYDSKGGSFLKTTITIIAPEGELPLRLYRKIKFSLYHLLRKKVKREKDIIRKDLN
jgi:hypothetical protein